MKGRRDTSVVSSEKNCKTAQEEQEEFGGGTKLSFVLFIKTMQIFYIAYVWQKQP